MIFLELDELKEIVAPANSRSMKRKKTDTSSSDEAWWKRRQSSRKASEQNNEAETELQIQNILKKFFDESQLVENRQVNTTAMNNTCKKSASTLNESLVEYSVSELKDTEAKTVGELLEELGPKESVHYICRAYLQRLSFNYHQVWPQDLDATYVRLVHYLNGQCDQWEAITRLVYILITVLMSYQVSVQNKSF